MEGSFFVACADCSPQEIWLWSIDSAPRLIRGQICSTALQQQPRQVALVFAEANKIRECHSCRSTFSANFMIPDVWWSNYCKKSNGYFGLQDILDDHSEMKGMVSWSRFLIKQVHGNNSYEWTKVNIFAQWLASGSQTILVFDAAAAIKTQLRRAILDTLMAEELMDPFWIHHRLLNEVLSMHDDAIWKIRDRVRTMELSEAGSSRPDYRGLHDLSRHAIHIVETVAVTSETIQRIGLHHSYFMAEIRNAEVPRRRMAKAIRDRLLFYEQMISSLHHRAVSTKDRLANEIQLSFNTVSQQDSAITIQISRIAQFDSATMKTISFLTFTFLPATFVSAVFSTSFFNFNPELQKWSVSDKFWVFWVVAIPITVVTPLLWRRLAHVSPLTVNGFENSNPSHYK